MTHKNRWIVQSRITPEADAALIKYSPVLRQVLFNRGYATEALQRQGYGHNVANEEQKSVLG